MFKLASFFVLCFALSAYGELSSRIVGGRDAPVGKYPYQASLRMRGSHICGASIINKRYILTAAHCVKSLRINTNELTIHVGTNIRTETGTMYEIENVVPHNRYNKLTLRNDIALIRVIKDIEFNDKVQPIPLDITNFAAEGTSAVLTGWGALSTRGSPPNELQEIDLKIASQLKCKLSQLRVSSAHICTFTKAGEGACYGDSGGPLVVDGVQVGIVSFGRPCGIGFPDVFTRVYSFADWIESTMY